MDGWKWRPQGVVRGVVGGRAIAKAPGNGQDHVKQSQQPGSAKDFSMRVTLSPIGPHMTVTIMCSFISDFSAGDSAEKGTESKKQRERQRGGADILSGNGCAWSQRVSDRPDIVQVDARGGLRLQPQGRVKQSQASLAG